MLPDPRERPLLAADELLESKVLPLKRSALYSAIGRGEIKTIRYGRKIYVINAALQEQLGLMPSESSEADTAVSAIASKPQSKEILSEHFTPPDAA